MKPTNHVMYLYSQSTTKYFPIQWPESFTELCREVIQRFDLPNNALVFAVDDECGNLVYICDERSFGCILPKTRVLGNGKTVHYATVSIPARDRWTNFPPVNPSRV